MIGVLVGAILIMMCFFVLVALGIPKMLDMCLKIKKLKSVRTDISLDEPGPPTNRNPHGQHINLATDASNIINLGTQDDI